MPKNEWNALRKGLPRQGLYARQLHQAAGVAEGPCGLPELRQFQSYLSTERAQARSTQTAESTSVDVDQKKKKYDSGDFLGDMKNEVEGDYIKEFASIGGTSQGQAIIQEVCEEDVIEGPL